MSEVAISVSDDAVEPAGQQGRPVRVFVSYSHDSAEHKQQVLSLCRLLRHLGVDIRVDEWDTDRRRDWYTWMTEQIEFADFIVVIASPGYREAADGLGPPERHRGVQTEAALLRDHLHSDRVGWLPKMLPVILPGRSIAEIPLFLQPFCADFYTIGQINLHGSEELLRVLTGQPGYVCPPLGPIPALPT
uniref:toll/interleukin-1 receptor domain-containing protein n=1 Tax=Amycolatopsis circi TaxID=871959 RepID=UPI000E23B40C